MKFGLISAKFGQISLRYRSYSSHRLNSFSLGYFVRVQKLKSTDQPSGHNGWLQGLKCLMSDSKQFFVNLFLASFVMHSRKFYFINKTSRYTQFPYLSLSHINFIFYYHFQLSLQNLCSYSFNKGFIIKVNFVITGSYKYFEKKKMFFCLYTSHTIIKTVLLVAPRK